MKQRLMDFLEVDEKWVTLYGTEGSVMSDEATFNRLFRGAHTGIIRRECSGCAASHQDVYIKVTNPSSWDAYGELLVTWTAHNFRRDFNIYSSLADAKADRNPWRWCNGGVRHIGFPRDCGPTGRHNGQWNSLTHGGKRPYKYSALVGPPPPDPTPAPTPSPTPVPVMSIWGTLCAKGNYGSDCLGEKEFNEHFLEAGTGIIRRLCRHCSWSHRTVYIKIYSPEEWNAYQELLVTWTANGFHSKFDIYSSLENALSGQNHWRACNGNYEGVGFPRDCGPDHSIGWQWTSLTLGWSRQHDYEYAVLLPEPATTTPPPTPEPTPEPTPAPTPSPPPPVVNASMEQVQDAQSAVVLSPHFHTLGEVAVVGPKPPPGEGGGGGEGGGQQYKAMVILYLFGGADTFNMLVPLDCPLYDQYRAIRSTVALGAGQLNRISTAGQACSSFGIHNRLGIVKQLYDDGDAAFVTNVGNLIEPILGRRGARTCPGGFSHNDMQHASQTLHCEMGTNFKHGGGGRMADALATGRGNFNVASFSLAGKAAWSEGEATRRSVISGSTSTGGFQPGRKVQRIIDNFTEIEFSSLYAKEYIKQFDESVNSFKAVSEALLNGDSLLRARNADYGGMEVLRQVARLIAARSSRRAERDFFFLGFGGFDMHTNLEMGLFNRFGTMDQGITAFVNEMKAQRVWDRVVLATQSDFARTLDPNANRGTDHAWAGQHFILSGALNGGKIYNQFPDSLAAGNPADVGRGRLIPKYPYESFMVPTAKWLGVDDSQLRTVFPNLANFNASFIIPDLLKR